MTLERPAPDAPTPQSTDRTDGDDIDAGLVQAMIGGSRDALGLLYDRHANTVYAAAMRVAGDPWIAAEVVQDTFLALWNRAELFDSSRGPLAAWVRRIARNRTIDVLRSAARHQRAGSFSSFVGTGADEQAIADWLTGAGELIGIAEPELGPEAALSSKETRTSISDAMAALGPLEREVISLAYDAGLSQSEIATRLGWPIGTVKTRTRRALHQLRERLANSPVAGDTTVTAQPDSSSARPGGAAAWSAGASPCAVPCP
jgi:RNA polymerase sigma-70 factor (ECF subfamily)